jgi:steroid 5-alpha reductase family enzyme
MLRTILLLIGSLMLIPIVAMQTDAPLSPEQWLTLKMAIYTMLGVSLYCFISSELTKNYSQVDKLWSIIPVVYIGIFTYYSHWDTRLTIMLGLVSLWAMRLTYNFLRRGGYHWLPWKGEEDYRWAVLRQNPLLSKRLNWTVFNFFFICLYQNSLILLFTLPIVVAWQGSETPINALDYASIILFLTFLVIETVADQQQFDFQKEKYRRIANGESLGELEHGFVNTGLWAYVRHPNYASEQIIWFSFYLFSVAATGLWINWSLIGLILLVLLFWASSDFSEKISADKYPLYKVYQKTTGRFLPKLKR